MSEPETTSDGRYIVVDGRRWRATDPAIPEERRAELTRILMGWRRDVRRTRGTDGEAETRAGVQAAKVALGERGTPWWEQTADERQERWSAVVPMPPDRQERMPSMSEAPVTYKQYAHVEGPFFHGTKAVLETGDELVPGHGSNFQEGRVSNHIYFTSLLSTAAWGAQLAAALAGSGERGHIYVVEPLGPFEDDPNVTDKKFPGNPTKSYRTRHPLRVVHMVDHWEGHPPEVLAAMLESLAKLRVQGLDVIED